MGVRTISNLIDVDLFSRAAVGLGSWNDALSAFTVLSGGHVGQIVGMDQHEGLIINLVTGSSPDLIDEYVVTGGPDPRINPRTRAVLQAAPLTVIAESDFGSADMVRNHPYYQSFHVPREVPYGALAKLIDNGGRSVALALMRSERQGHLTDEQRRIVAACLPLVRDAVATGLMLEQRQLALLGGALDHLDIPLFALTPAARIVSLSAAAERVLMQQEGLIGREGLLMPLAPERRRDFADAVRATGREHPMLMRRARRLLLRLGHGCPPLTVEIAPLPIDHSGWLHTACCLVSVRRGGECRADLPAYLGYYGLTPAECAITMRLIEGEDSKTIAEARGVGEATVRNQIKTILAKTGFHRQIDLVRQLSR